MTEGQFHAAIAVRVLVAITHRISELQANYGSDTDTHKVLALIEAFRNGTVRYPNGMSCPDNHFSLVGKPFPSIVLEVADSQPWEGLSGLARKLHQHIVSSDGEINIAIGLEISKARPLLSIWVPKIVSQYRLERHIILNRHPITKEDKKSLDIYVKDFVPATSRNHFPGLDQTAKISIPFADIADAVQMSWDSSEMAKHDLTLRVLRKQCYEKQEYFAPPPAPLKYPL